MGVIKIETRICVRPWGAAVSLRVTPPGQEPIQRYFRTREAADYFIAGIKLGAAAAGVECYVHDCD